MADLSNPYHRRSIRLDGYDYTQAGGYYLALVTWQRECLFGEIVGGEMRLNHCGQVAQEEWKRTAEMRPEFSLGEWVIMPNHLHAVLWICHARTVEEGLMESARQHLARSGARGAPLPDRPPRSVGSCIAGYKSAVYRRINAIRQTPGAPVWQRNYYEHIIRSQEDLERIERYIIGNPLQWESDEENPAKCRQ